MTNPDTSTLNGSLEQLGLTLASNLTTMGVTGASASDGLTTLANKILDISPATITLSTNKNILSYYDSETATLTATHSWGAGKTVELYNATTGVKIGDMIDNNDGTYSYTYTSTNAGNISMTAVSGTAESNSITIEDILIYKEAELSFQSSGTKVQAGLYTSIGDIANTNWEFEYKIKSNGDGGGFNIGASTQYTPPSSANYRLYIGGDSSARCSFNNRTTSSSTSYESMSTNTYHTLKLVKNGSTITAYLDGTQFASKTVSWLSNYNSWDLYWINWGSTNYAKEIKFKLL